MLIRAASALLQAEALAGRARMHVALRELGFSLLAAVVAVLGLVMADVAAFLALARPVGPLWAAAGVAACDFAAAGLVMVLASQGAPRRELDEAQEMRAQALEAFEGSVADVAASVDELLDEAIAAKDRILGALHNPVEVPARRLLVPAMLVILRGLQSRAESKSAHAEG